eukprot:jgi/Chrzof1/10612/Cz05g05060.t1_CPSFL1
MQTLVHMAACPCRHRLHGLRHVAHHQWTPNVSRHRGAGRCYVSSTTSNVEPDPPGLRPEPWTGNPQQQQALQHLRQRLSSCPYPCPDDSTLRWYLRDRYFDPVEAEQKLVSMLRWKQYFRPTTIPFTAVEREYNTGKAYVAQHPDKYGRPAIVIRASKHITGEFPIDDSKRLCTYLLDQAIEQLPDGSEQLIGLFDLRGFQLQNADLAFAAFMIEAFFDYYPRRVGQVLLVDAPWVFRPPWEAIKPLMRKYAALVSFVSAEQVHRDYFTPDTVPEDFKS